ncbi:hypothetical protein [Marimonas arenosa]|uniref:Uncharacterized protein n=1 Tax=Marimonas arenosa TaxID=1795305 RepID=A0AAE4B7N3_9RHOB|nr:hypothetical protein [Marimonas arenosa]MDQ2091716.1 hypothetical protein [Marimonas arenosa]
MTTQRAPSMVTRLLDGEVVLAVWRPQLAMFAQRALLLSFATALALASLGYLTTVQWLIAVPVFTVLFIFIFDDHTTWFRHRDEAWFLTTQRLVFEKASQPEENAAVPLFAVEWMQPWAWWSLRLGFQGGTSTAIRFVARPRDIRAKIAAARDKAMEQAGTPDA